MATINELDAAIKEIKESGLGGNQVHEETMRTALEALQDARRRADGCDRCNESRCGICKKTDTACCSSCNNFCHFESERFCKECGRALRGEKEERE